MATTTTTSDLPTTPCPSCEGTAWTFHAGAFECDLCGTRLECPVCGTTYVDADDVYDPTTMACSATCNRSPDLDPFTDL